MIYRACIVFTLLATVQLSAAVYQATSVTQVNGLSLSGGDTVYFTTGTTYSGTALSLGRTHAGSVGNPVVISARGAGFAEITVSSGSALSVSASNITVRKIRFKGPWNVSLSGASSPNGVALSTNQSNVTLDSCEVTGFAAHGISGGGTNLRINRCFVYDVGWDGINISSATNLYLGYTRVRRATGWARTPHSGSGILLGGVTKGLIEYCRTDSNGYKFQASDGGGPVGCWAWNSDSITIQYCESHHNDNGNRGIDGGGFDFDGGVTNSVMQYCYSHDNEGPGFLICHFSGSRPTGNLTVRYCVSLRDSRTWQGAVSFYSFDAAQPYNTVFHNNVIFANQGGGTAVARETAIGPGNAFYNNIIITTNSVSFNKGAAANFKFVNNCYWSLNGVFKYNGGAQTSIEAFRATGQERLNNADVGMQADPKVEAIAQGSTVGDPTRMAEILTQYRLLSNSPCINTGINIQTLFSINPGTRDFYGNPIPVGGAYDIGVCENQGVTPAVERAAIYVPVQPRAYESGQVFDLCGRLSGAVRGAVAVRVNPEGVLTLPGVSVH